MEPGLRARTDADLESPLPPYCCCWSEREPEKGRGWALPPPPPAQPTRPCRVIGDGRERAKRAAPSGERSRERGSRASHQVGAAPGFGGRRGIQGCRGAFQVFFSSGAARSNPPWAEWPEGLVCPTCTLAPYRSRRHPTKAQLQPKSPSPSSLRVTGPHPLVIPH